MTNEERFALITRNLEEVLTEDDLRHFLEHDIPLKHYIGFEISGQVHVGGGLITAMKLKDFIEAGVDVTVFLADWHAWINHKLGGKLDIISKAADYIREVHIASMKCVGGDSDKVNFLLGTELYKQRPDYFEIIVQVAQKITLSRIQRSIAIMGRKEEEAVDFAMLLYPIMQVADIFAQNLSIVHAGMDQRKAHVVMRDVAHLVEKNSLKGPDGKQLKPVALHHRLLMGLSKPDSNSKKEQQQELSEIKMSKSKPDSAIFMTDSSEEIERKITKSYCPEGEVKLNPVLDWTQHLVFPIRGMLSVERDEKFGGNIKYTDYHVLEKDFAEKKLHPTDLKNALASELVDILAPAREHFASGQNKKLL